MQPIGRPVGSHIRSVTPDRSELLPADGLPYVLAVTDVLPSKQNRSIRADHPFEYWGSLAVDLRTVVPQHRKRCDDDDGQSPPEPTIRHEVPLMNLEFSRKLSCRSTIPKAKVDIKVQMS